jgi:hypothetical protein
MYPFSFFLRLTIRVVNGSFEPLKVTIAVNTQDQHWFIRLALKKIKAGIFENFSTFNWNFS